MVQSGIYIKKRDAEQDKEKKLTSIFSAAENSKTGERCAIKKVKKKKPLLLS